MKQSKRNYLSERYRTTGVALSIMKNIKQQKRTSSYFKSLVIFHIYKKKKINFRKGLFNRQHLYHEPLHNQPQDPGKADKWNNHCCKIVNYSPMPTKSIQWGL